MENLYKELRSFFANDIDLTDLFDSEAIIWIDWREYDEDVVNYFNDMMDEPIDIKKELQIPYGDEQDRDVTIKYFNDFIKPDYEVRWFVESLGNDTLGFTVLSVSEWAKLDGEFGADTVRYYFEPIDFESDMFNLGMDEVFALLALRENSEGVNTQFSTQLDWIRIINKEKTLAEQKENGQIDLKQYMVAKKELQQIKDDFVATHGEME
ncbi:MAG: hypothetical protein KHW53_09095 [Veillonella sp.]|uniref:hypothetical protein n=1 Tax=Veillonella sp. TaxID=1926307 RepID=UPI0025797157|nr:hypothetical protein [Veillonella sp.]MBS5756762.1 hypothetical protein [Veillonella sp.]